MRRSPGPDTTRSRSHATWAGRALALALLAGAPAGLAGVARAEEDPCVRVESYLNKGEHTLAEGAAKACLTRFPNVVRVWYLMSRALAGQKRYSEALAWADKAIERYPGDKDLHIWRIRLLAWSGDMERAWNERYKIIKVAEQSRDAAMLIADVAFWRKDCVEAVKWYDYIAKKWPNSERAKANRDRCISDASIISPAPEESVSAPPAAGSSSSAAGEEATAANPVLPWRKKLVATGAAPSEGASSSSAGAVPAGSPPSPAAAPAASSAGASGGPAAGTTVDPCTRCGPTPGGAAGSSPLPVKANSCENLSEFLRKKDYRKAEAQSRECMKVNKTTKPYNTLFAALLGQNRQDEALKEVDQKLASEPNSQFFRYWRVKILTRQGKRKLAWKESGRLGAYSDSSFASAYQTAKLAYLNGMYDVAVDQFRTLLQRWPTSRWSRLYLSKSLAKLGGYAEAIGELTVLCHQDHFNHACRELYWLRRVSPMGSEVVVTEDFTGEQPADLQDEDAGPAQASYTVSADDLPLFTRVTYSPERAQDLEKLSRKRVSANRRDRKAWMDLLAALDAQGKDNEGLKWAIKGRLGRTSDCPFYMWQMRFLAHLGRYDEAWAIRSEVRPMVPISKRVVKLLGDLAFARQDYKEALSIYAYYLKRWPGTPDVLFLRGLAHGLFGDSQQAGKDIRMACRNGGSRHVACSYGQRAVQPRLQASRTTSGAAVDAIRQHAYAGDYGRALALVDRLLLRRPRDMGLRLWRVRVLAWRGDLDLAWQEVMELEPLFGKDQDASRLVADIAYWRKDFPEAVERYTLYDVLWPNDSSVLLNRGRAYLELSDFKAARHDFFRACQAEGASSPSCVHMKDLESGKTIATILHEGPTFVDRRDTLRLRGSRTFREEQTEEEIFPTEETAQSSYLPLTTGSGGSRVGRRRLRGSYGTSFKCSDYAQLLGQGMHREAEVLLRRCLHDPEFQSSPEYWVGYSKALAGQKKYATALTFARRAVAASPASREYKLWLAKLKAWSNDLEGAWRDAKALYLGRPSDQEATLLVADVAFWRKDYLMAATLYSRYLRRWPADLGARLNRGRAYMELGERELGSRDLTIVCSEQGQDSAACSDLDYQEFRARMYNVMFQAGFMPVHDEPQLAVGNAFSLMGLFSVNFGRKLQIGTDVLLMGRDFAGDYNFDVMWEVFASYRWQNGWSLAGGVGFTFYPDYLPLVSARLEGAYELPWGLRPSLMIWRLQHSDAGTSVVSPALSYTADKWSILGQFYLGVQDDGDIGTSFLAKATLSPIPLLTFMLGGAVGSRPEYIELTEALNRAGYEPYFFWSVMTGIYFSIRGQHNIMLDYVFRDEQARSAVDVQGAPFVFSKPEDELHFRQHMILLGYRFTF